LTANRIDVKSSANNILIFIARNILFKIQTFSAHFHYGHLASGGKLCNVELNC